MKSMLAAMIAMVVISIAAWWGLGQAGFSAAEQGTSGSSVRLD